MRGAVAGCCRGGPFLFLPEVPPGVRPSSAVFVPGCRLQLQISNRYTNLLETVVTRRNQKTAPTSNRYKSRLFFTAHFGGWKLETRVSVSNWPFVLNSKPTASVQSFGPGKEPQDKKT